jgi:hypothetical protein
MSTKKFILGGLAGGILMFLLGWLLFGVLFMDFMQNHSRQHTGVYRSEADMVWEALIAGNLVYGLLLSYVIQKSDSRGMVAGAITGAVLGLLMNVTVDCMLYAQLDLWGKKALVADVALSVLSTTITGAVLGWMNRVS